MSRLQKELTARRTSATNQVPGTPNCPAAINRTDHSWSQALSRSSPTAVQYEYSVQMTGITCSVTPTLIHIPECTRGPIEIAGFIFCYRGDNCHFSTQNLDINLLSRTRFTFPVILPEKPSRRSAAHNYSRTGVAKQMPPGLKTHRSRKIAAA